MVNIGKHLQKDYWVRRVTPDGGRPATPFGVGYRPQLQGGAGVAYLNLTQDDLLNEIESSAHIINSKYMSQRPVYGPTGNKNKDGKEEWAVVGYDDLETVSLGLQKCIALKKASHFAADGFWIANETKDTEDFDILCSWRDSVGLDTAYIEIANSCFQTGDAAIYLYQQGKEIEYEVFSFLKGDRLYPGLTENGERAVYRQYTLRGKTAVDVFADSYRETWVKVDDSIEENKGWLGSLFSWLKTEKGERSEDGYTRVYRAASQTGAGMNQCIYFRVPDIPSGPAQNSIEALERACSYAAEEVKGSAFPILFLKSEKVINLPPTKNNSKILGVKGTAETVKNSDAKFLTPPDASNIASTNIKTLTDNILRSTLSVFIEPDILKSGADSSTTIKILYAPEIQWCQNMWIYFAKPVKRMVDVFKTLVGKVEEKMTVYSEMRLSVGQNIWIPQNESERVKIELDQVYARVKSRKSAMQDIGNQHIGDFEQIEQEWEKELDIKSRVPARAKAEIEEEYGASSEEEIVVEEEDNPNKPDIDNNSKGKSIVK
jgi:hypothetical protein